MSCKSVFPTVVIVLRNTYYQFIFYDYILLSWNVSVCEIFRCKSAVCFFFSNMIFLSGSIDYIKSFTFTKITKMTQYCQ